MAKKDWSFFHKSVPQKKLPWMLPIKKKALLAKQSIKVNGRFCKILLLNSGSHQS